MGKGFDFKSPRSKKGKDYQRARGGLYRSFNGFFQRKAWVAGVTNFSSDPDKRFIQKKGRTWQKEGFSSFKEYFNQIKKQDKEELEHLVSKGKHPITITEKDVEQEKV